jgi:hypothetical protein
MSKNDVVTQEGDAVRFGRRFRRYEFDYFLKSYKRMAKRGPTRWELDFSKTEIVHTQAMLSVVASVDRLHRDGHVTQVVLPEHAPTRDRFADGNWAALLDPDHFEARREPVGLAIPCRRFVNFRDQQQIVNEVVQVVSGAMQLSRDVLSGLEWSINEITDNVLNHAECATGGLVQVHSDTERQYVTVTVADGGRGILASMQEGFPHLTKDADAIGEAVKIGVTRNPAAGQGNGLAGALRVSTMSGGVFEIASGGARMIARLDKTERAQWRGNRYFPGTMLHVVVSSRRQFSIAQALDFGGMLSRRVDFIDLQHDVGEEGTLVLRLREETTGYGTRRAGGFIRTKCLNLLNADPSARLIIDWEGVPLISSSFADEAVGKLFLELGPMQFNARVRNVSIEGLVAALVDQAIIQRMKQGFVVEVID